MKRNRFIEIKIIITWIFIFSTSSLFGQIEEDGLKQAYVLYQYRPNSVEYEGYEIENIHLGKEMQINFDCCFNDSIIVLLNEKKIYEGYIETDFSTSFAKGLRPKLKRGQQILKVILPNKKVFIEIILDKRYKMLQINGLEVSKSRWSIVFGNYYLPYE